MSLWQHVPADVLARVYSYDALGSFVAIPLGQLAASSLAGLLGVPTTLDAAVVAPPLAAAVAPAVPAVSG